jgi:signal transduction histidine kinase
MRRTDVVVAVVLGVLSVPMTLGVDGTDFTAFARTIAAVAASAPVAWRHSRPVHAALTTGGITLGFTVIDQDYTQSPTPLIALVLCTYSMAAVAPRRQFIACGAALSAGACWASLAAGDYADVASSVLFALVILSGPPLAIGRLAHRRAATARLLEQRAAELEEERRRAPARAAEAERARVAAELHELVSEAVRGMLAEAAAARRLVVARDPGAAEAAGRVEDRGRDALVDMRRLLGVLREGDEELELAPQPTLARLDTLAARLSRHGLTVDVRSDGSARALAPGLDVAAYRVIEDVLAGARGARRADVVVRWGPATVELEVAVDGPQLADPSRLAGVRERVELFGGSLRAGRRPGGGSALVAGLPDAGVPA